MRIFLAINKADQQIVNFNFRFGSKIADPHPASVGLLTFETSLDA